MKQTKRVAPIFYKQYPDIVTLLSIVTRKCNNFRVTIHGNLQLPGVVTRKLKFPLFLSCTISRYCYSEVDQFPGIDSQKFFNFRVLLLQNCQFLGNNTWKFDNFQLPGNNTQKLTKRPKCWVNFWVTIPQNFQFPSIVTRKLKNNNSNNTWKLFNFRVLLPGSCFEKILLS